MSSAARARGLSPDSSLNGTFRPPGSKSAAQRAVLAAALARHDSGSSTIRALPDNDDVNAALALADGLGADVQKLGPGHCLVLGIGGRSCQPAGYVDAGESGTLARFATAVLACLSDHEVHLGVRGTLLRRRSAPLIEALESLGVRLEPIGDDGTWPLLISSQIAPMGQAAPVDQPVPLSIHLKHPVSSQEVSALWIAASACPASWQVRVDGQIPSAPYLNVTREVLSSFGARLVGEPHHMQVHGPLRSCDYEVEADASSAAVALAAACLSGGKLSITGISSHSFQGDVRILEYLRAFGCDTSVDPNLDSGAGLHAERLSAWGRPLRGATLDLSSEPDLAPVLAVVAAAAALTTGARSELLGLETLRGKESDRIGVLARGLSRAGLNVVEHAASLVIEPSKLSRNPIELDPDSDHRMAFAFALLGLVRPNVRVRNPGCVSKSWPTFWEDLEGLGARGLGA